MALGSELFTQPGNAEIDNCLAFDSHHIAPGAFGQHVKLIQIALSQLLPIFLVIDGRYGPKTAAVVASYKNARRILGPGQTSVDNIVGKLTIQRLDDEMKAFEDALPRPSRLVETRRGGRDHDHLLCPTAPSIRNTRVQHVGTPINPLGAVRVNIGGEGETAYLKFIDCTTDSKSLFGPLGRPLTQTFTSHSVTDMCTRSSPITNEALDGGQGEKEVSRIARPGCRFTYANNPARVELQMPFLISLGNIIEDISLPDLEDDGLRVIVVIMRGDGKFTPRAT